MNKIFPKKLKKGDEVRVVAPSMSLAIISEETRKIAKERFDEMGLRLSFSKHAEEIDSFNSSSLESRVSDFNEAFSDPKISAVFAVIGGFNCNQMLDYIDWDIVQKNPKVFCGYSDTTALQNAIFAKTGIVTYSGPSYSTFGQKKYFDYILDNFKKCLFSEEPFVVEPSKNFSDDEWYIDQENRKLHKNKGPWVINEGKAKGTILGANLCTFNLLQGTKYMPDLSNSVLFIEDDEFGGKHTDIFFDRNLQSLIQQPNLDKVKGMLIGRFQIASEINRSRIESIIKGKGELANLPVLANLDFGHTYPMFTFPIGGEVEIEVTKKKQEIKIVRH